MLLQFVFILYIPALPDEVGCWPFSTNLQREEGTKKIRELLFV